MNSCTAQNMKFSIKDFFRKCDFFTFTEEILNGKLHFLCSAASRLFIILKIFHWIIKNVMLTSQKQLPKKCSMAKMFLKYFTKFREKRLSQRFIFTKSYVCNLQHVYIYITCISICIYNAAVILISDVN